MSNPKVLCCKTNPIAIFIASGCYSGFIPYSPGTAGSLACLVLWWIFSQLVSRIWFIDAVLIGLCILVGLWCTKLCLEHIEASSGEEKHKQDPQFIVIDEWAGLLIALCGIAATDSFSVLLAFVLFRFFDIVKIGPVAWAEKLPGAWGVMMDDIVAGILAVISLACLVHGLGLAV